MSTDMTHEELREDMQESLDRMDAIIANQRSILAETSASISDMRRRIKEHKARLANDHKD